MRLSEYFSTIGRRIKKVCSSNSRIYDSDVSSSKASESPRLNELSLEGSEVFNKTNRIEQWWSNEESRIMAELRNIGK
ncbi:21685_t:CDS:2 [Dentiscutata erythropus]|uniref:21685_t:CDS:1 n=1 Tax=Dentiscutata erythropus TaxID=1348616 RepID=A0A9N9CUY0_9GLOM|nr:21685_t:CDS:2 [Dentiscutata erythropus]